LVCKSFFSAGDELFSVRYEMFTMGEDVGDELLTVATAFDRVYVYCACM